MIEKLQSFLKKKHKFDKKLDMYDILEILDMNFNAFRGAVKSEEIENVKKSLSNFLVGIIKYCNTRDINIQEVIKEDFNLE
ncbi:hypothetical protein DSAG12_00949 [Promethearchaeum syntrophicum]|uniref:Uncharacterized protein n=1 Tax=Promethearchaeum syntrophicum TaxID=2594042 RepID=A0A5B9D948_9ARCH|nr:hypothetical protein [Candidatus Prometheoarchaeum syntrophicum]QEE15126.1 hypothetical protein DSAG12_00949 [Candidatus Prometheoarchaeum syntrophicum]